VRRTRPFFNLCAFLVLITAGLVLYSQTYSFAWDEGFHLLAAQLIDAGKRPWLDFLFPQTPLNAYWNAGWMRLFGQSWRVSHAVAALVTAGAVLLTADFLFTRLPVARWRLAGALAGALLVGWNVEVVDFATTGQAYGMCLFLSVAAFRLSIAAVERKGAWLSASAGLLAGAAAASSLLTAAAAPVLLVWILLHNRAGRGPIKFAAFVFAAAVPFLPVLWLFAQAPRRVLFNVIEYQALFRRVNWGHPWRQDFTVLLSWIDSTQALLLGLLAVAGLLFIAKRSQWDRARRAEFYLCGWLALAIGVELFTAHPTFARYFLLIVPFLAIPAAAGLCAAGSLILDPERPMWPVLALGLLTFAALARSAYEDRDAFSWQKMEQLAAKTDQVTPASATLWADEPIYFLTRRSPPPGMEFAYSHKLNLPDAEAASLRILSNAALKRQVASGVFSTVETCEEAETIESLNLPRLYAHKAEVADCAVFWDKVPAHP
jgi:4-amino-4-deoxy-L-arabinose transferase-like glycosyltransferase